MLRHVAALLITSALIVPSYAQAPTAQPANTAARPASKKMPSKPKAKAARPAAETGPCSLGVISAIGDRFFVDKFGVTVFETEETEVPIEGWGLDELVLTRVRAAAGADPSIRKIGYPKGSFEPYYNPKSRFLPDPREGLPAIVRDITSNANCERYLVVTTFKGQIPGSNLTLNGIGTYNRGLGSIIRHSHLFANITINMLDGKSYEKISSFAADTGSRLAEGLRITEDPLEKLDNADFPDPPSRASNSASLRDRVRTLVAAKLDRDLPSYLKTQ